ncbi:hypothetical protein ACFQXB_13720 [Plastorhodobacter daqingensis]|uniref:Transposase n=1 Tax=Plastorhodobacter daqingensis TaxID=1387281 RepID=A0ABW2UM16_9RHOB
MTGRRGGMDVGQSAAARICRSQNAMHFAKHLLRVAKREENTAARKPCPRVFPTLVRQKPVNLREFA